ncbi:MAG: hypothetical protein JKX86_04430 [Verrucomicrobiales bacterium]|nr:hypothetical protein [Verrucomicrobiales bacterium]
MSFGKGISSTPDHGGLRLTRNPDAHIRVITIDELLDVTVGARCLDHWIDPAAQQTECLHRPSPDQYLPVCSHPKIFTFFDCSILGQ